MLGGSEFHAGAHRSAVLAFLKATLGGGAKAVCDLELKARSAGLLSERQRVTHSKVFKWAKNTLAIRSIRSGFAAAGGWSWVLPQDLGSDVAQSTRHVSTNQPPAIIYGAEFKLPANTVERIGVPREWIDGVASLNRHRAPAHVPLHRWLVLIDDCERFLDPNAIWAAEAAAKGWNAEALFGCARTQPLAYLQVAGLLWVVAGRKLIKLHRDWAAIENLADGSLYVVNRRHIYGAQITLPWRLR
jgi:hypothetical protein